MLLLALYPILYSYMSSYNLNYGEIGLGLATAFGMIHYGMKDGLVFPSKYLYFWIYVSITLIITSNSFKFTYLIPGGIAFSLFSLNWAFSSRVFHLDSLYKCMKIVFFIAVLVYIAQLLHLMPNQYQYIAVFPISDHIAYADIDYQGLMNLREGTIRPCSLFLEPAYFAQYALIFLALEMFYKTDIDRLLTPISFITIIVLLLLRSGLGFCGLIVLLSIKCYDYLKKSRNGWMTLLLIAPVLIYFLSLFLVSEAGVELMERKSEFQTEGSSGFLRIVQGFLIFDALPLFHKLFGISMESVAAMQLPFFTYTSTGEVSLFTNGFCTVLIKTGLMGLLLLLFVYYKMFKNGSMLSKTLVILLLVMSMIEQVYLTSSMLLCSVIANSETTKSK